MCPLPSGGLLLVVLVKVVAVTVLLDGDVDLVRP